jgi:hypothetical protein
METTLKVKKALSDGDHESLSTLMAIHQRLMTDLKQIGCSQDTGMAGLVQDLLRQVDDVVMEIKKQQAQVGRQMRVIGRQRKLSSAYGYRVFSTGSANEFGIMSTR